MRRGRFAASFGLRSAVHRHYSILPGGTGDLRPSREPGRPSTAMAVDPVLLPGEEILYSIRANHFLGGEGRGGKLHLTAGRILFTPHRFNVQLDPWSATWESVAGFSIRDSAAVSAVAVVAGVPEEGF